MLGRTILKEPVVFYRQGNGEVVALEDRCAHRFAPLSMGHVVGGNRIQCPYHGLEYDKTGACVLQPHGNKNIPSRARVKSYPVTEKHKAIWIWMGDQPADPAKVPDFSVMDNVPELHTTKLDKIMVKANVELVIDNLLDLSHTSYLHAGILGNADTVESDIGVEQEGDDIVVSRYARNGEPPGMNKLMWPDVPAKVDKFTRIRWMAPSTLRLVTGVCRPGETPEQGSGYHAVHILTPETDQTTHYFFTAVRFGIFSKGDELNRQIQEKVGGDPPVRLRGAGRAGDRGAAADHRCLADQRRPADPGDRCRPGALQAGAEEADRGGTGGVAPKSRGGALEPRDFVLKSPLAALDGGRSND